VRQPHKRFVRMRWHVHCASVFFTRTDNFLFTCGRLLNSCFCESLYFAALQSVAASGRTTCASAAARGGGGAVEAMATSSESDAGDCRRRTPSCARRRSRSAATRSARGATASAEPERGEAPQAGKGQRDTEAAPASGWSRRWQPVAEPSPEAAGKGRGRGRRPSQHSPSKGDKGGKGKYTFFGKGGGKSSSQRGEAPARASLSPQGRSGAKSAGKGPRESRLQEGEMLRCAWPGSAKDTFAAEGALSFADMLTTSENLSCKLELRGRERKGQGLKRI
jgi:hypothetical protein